jgi:hypothetical protein
MHSVSPIAGWALDAIAHLDGYWPGLAGHFLRASDERRQVIAAFVAAVRIEADEAAVAGEFLAAADHRTILHLAYGDVPKGLRGALARSGSQPHEPTYYVDLFNILFDPAQHRVAEIIRRLPTLDRTRIDIARLLPPEICFVSVIMRLDDVEEARDLVQAVGIMEERGVSRANLVRALGTSKEADLGKVVGRWALAMSFPSNPIPACAGFRPIRNGRELRRVALQYRNCGRRYLTQALEGDNAFGELQHAGSSVLLHLVKRDGVWTYESAYAARNKPVAADVASAAERFAARHGIVRTPRFSSGQKGLAPLQRLGALHGGWW